MPISRIAAILLIAACAGAPAITPSTLAPDQYANVPVFVSGGAITAPKAIARVEPLPPREFRASRNYAIATAEVVIDRQGNVVDAWYFEGDRQWAQILIKALRAWKFAPATLQGEPIMVRFKVSSTFRSNM